MDNLWHHQSQDFFAGLESQKKNFLSQAQRRIYKKNDIIFFEGDRGNSCFYVTTGLIRIFSISESGKEPIFFLRRPGEIFGLSEVLNDYPRKANAQAIAPSEVYCMNSKDFDAFLSHDYMMARRVITMLGARIRHLGDTVSNLVSSTVMARLIKLLISLACDQLTDAETWTSPISIDMCLSQEQMAAMTGSTQPTVSDLLQQLKKAGLVTIAHRKITLNNPLQLLAEIETITCEKS
ncbi:MAG: Crp/Fnr family transcriptional regulator [Desulfovibrio sp.]|jgi:CRP-like cAMP-binding protein|nr:Crp/Fnr family transcriptional regulator [Desulfovibrio sp.]